MSEEKKYSHEEMGFGDVQTDEDTPSSKGAKVPTVHPTPLPKASTPVPPPLPALPPAKPQSATEILPPMPPAPSIVDNPVNQENAKTVGAAGAGAAGLATLLGVGLPLLYKTFAGNKTPPQSGPELTMNPAAPEAPIAPVAEAPVQTIKSRTFNPNAPVTDEELIARSERNAPIRQEYMNRLNQPQEAGALNILKNEAAAQSQLAPEYVPQAAEAITPVASAEKAAPVKTEKSSTAASKTVVAPEGMRPQYEKSPKKNPMGPGGYNWIYGQEGERAPATWENLFGKKNVPYEEAQNKYMEFQMTGQEPGRGLNELPRGEMGGANKKPKFIPEYIKGGATLGGLGAAAGGGLAALGVVQAIKHGKETGDWSNLAQFGVDTIAGAINPALLVGTHMEGLNTGEAEELAKKRYEGKVGGGRGVAPPSPRSQVGRR